MQGTDLRSTDEDGGPADSFLKPGKPRISPWLTVPKPPEIKQWVDWGTEQKLYLRKDQEHSDPWSGFRGGIYRTEEELSC